MSTTQVLLPGEQLPAEQLPRQPKASKALTVGPGLHFDQQSTLEARNAGTVSVDSRKYGVWMENNGKGRYLPAVGDLVIAIVHHAAAEQYYCQITPHAAHATLGYLAFEGVTRKTRPMLQHGSVVYARVSQAHKQLDSELECMHPSTGKAEGMGELKGGMLFSISLGMARRLLLSKPREDGQVGILEDLGANGLRFEIAVGRNGQIWINSDSVKNTIAIGRLLQETDRSCLTLEQQVEMVKHIGRSS